jgi:hypothetical protein
MKVPIRILQFFTYFLSESYTLSQFQPHWLYCFNNISSRAQRSELLRKCSHSPIWGSVRQVDHHATSNTDITNAVLHVVVFWIMILYSLRGGYQRFGGIYFIIFRVLAGNISKRPTNHIPDYNTVTQPTRSKYECLPQWKPEIVLICILFECWFI